MTRALKLLVVFAALALALPMALAQTSAQSDQSTLASLLSRVLSTPENRVRIGAVEGALSSNAVIRDVTIADDDGVWLRLDRASIVWSRAALLRGRLHINELVADRLEYLRPPSPDRERPPRADGPLLPNPPVELIVDRFALTELALGEAVLGTSARLAAEGRARLGDAAQGLSLSFRMRRLDAPGRAAIELAYVPQTNRLALDLDYAEPDSGIAARALDLPGLPPVELRLAGDAPLESFDATLRFVAGPTIGADGRATVRRGERDYRVALAFDARIDGLMPAPVAPVFRGTTRLTGTTSFADDGGITIERLRLGAPLAALEVNGRMTAGRELDVRVTGGAVPTDGTVTRAEGAEIGRLALDLAVTGPLAAPRVNGTVDAADIVVREGRLARFEARLDTQPIGGARPAERFSLALDATARGIAPRDAGSARAIGGELRVRARAIAETSGAMHIDEAVIETPTARLRFAGDLATDRVDGRLEARVPQLEPFAALADAPLRGGARLDVTVAGDPSRSELRFGLEGALSGFSTGVAVVDGLFGRDVALTGAILQQRRGFGFEALRLRGGNLDVAFDGTATQQAADLRVVLAIAELRRLDPRIGAGRAEASGQLAGSLSRPTLTAVARLRDVVALGRPVPRLDVALQARNIPDAIEASLSLEGEVENNRANGQILLRQLADGGVMLERLDVSVGSVAVRGAGRVDGAGLASGEVTLAARDLSDIAPLALMPLGGNVNAQIQLAVADDDQDARITAEGARLRIGDVQIATFATRLSLTGLHRRPVIDGTVTAESLTAGGQSFRRIRLTAQGATSASAFTAAAEAQGFALTARGRLVPDPAGHRVELASFEAVRQRRRFALAGPASITVIPGGARLSDVVIAADGGRIAVAGSVGQSLDLTVDARAVPLSIAEVFAPGTGLSGTLDGNARIRGSAAEPSGEYRVRVARLALPPLRQAGVASLDVNASGRLGGGRVTVDGTVAAARAGTVRVTGSAPLGPDGALDLSVAGRIDLAVANVFLSADGRRVSGTAAVDLSIVGPVARPTPRGTVTISGGSFADELQGVRFTAITAQIRAEGETVRIERFSARAPNGGDITASGRVAVNPDAGFPGELRITGRRAQLAANPTYTAVADLDLALSGPLARAPVLVGRIGVVSLDVTVPDRLPATLRPLPNTRHVRPPPQVQARLAREQRRTARRGTRSAAFEARLDLTVTALNRIFVRGRGINAELGGEIRLTGSSSAPVAIGAFELRRGRFDLLGQRLDFTRGRLDFTGDLTPSLDFLAETQSGEVTARIAVTGPANMPTFTLSSTPDLPQDEVLSRILFNRAAGGLSAGQALQLASAVATLAGGSGGGAFEQVRRSLGVDSLDVTTGAGGPAVGVSRYITDNVRLGVRGGANPADSGVTVDIDITRRVRVQGEAGGNGRTSVGVGVEWEW